MGSFALVRASLRTRSCSQPSNFTNPWQRHGYAYSTCAHAHFCFCMRRLFEWLPPLTHPPVCHNTNILLIIDPEQRRATNPPATSPTQRCNVETDPIKLSQPHSLAPILDYNRRAAIHNLRHCATSAPPPNIALWPRLCKVSAGPYHEQRRLEPTVVVLFCISRCARPSAVGRVHLGLSRVGR
jgi:hypothetical protein